MAGWRTACWDPHLIGGRGDVIAAVVALAASAGLAPVGAAKARDACLDADQNIPPTPDGKWRTCQIVIPVKGDIQRRCSIQHAVVSPGTRVGAAHIAQRRKVANQANGP